MIVSGTNLWMAAAASLAAVGAAEGAVAPSLVVYRMGDGVQTLSNNGNSAYLDRYTTAGGTPVGSVDLSGTGTPFSASGRLSVEGLITTAPDGQTVAFTGYGRAPGGTTALSTTAASAVPRVVGLYNAATGRVDESTALTDAYSAGYIDGAYTDGNGNLYTSGTASAANAATGGVRYTTFGSTASTGVTAGGQTSDDDGSEATSPNTRFVTVAGGQLYFSSGNGADVGVNSVGTGTPTTGGQPAQNVDFLDNDASPYSFLFLSLKTPGVLDTCYVADDSNGILKFSLDGSDDYDLDGHVNAPGIAGLTGYVDAAGNADLFATSASSLFSLVDASGFGNAPTVGSASVIASAPAGEAFRGVTVVTAAVPEPASAGLAFAGGVGLLARRRRRRP